MIIDSHVHMSEPPYERSDWSIKLADGTDVSLGLGEGVDLSVNHLLHDMDECHVEKALVVAVSGVLSNKFLSEVVKAHPKRLVGFAWVTNPRTDQSVRELEKAVNELGLKGLKLHPGIQGFTPADREILPLIRRAAELNVPIFIHSAPWPPGYFYNCLPEHIDALKKRVPKATIIVGHMGYQRFLDLLFWTALTSGIYVEPSWGLTMIADLYGIDFATRFIRRIGVDKVVFGSDWMGTNNERKAQLGVIEKMNLTREEKEKILGENIRNVLETRS
ncbi:amidohydrolase family protein [Candidatus Bathyarchaeota archaeon]|nr:amidohydrolase family protein [Candidatus Bathyarchaeota archaeon]